MHYFLAFFIGLTLSAHGQVNQNSGTFSITVQGEQKHLSYIQKRAEWQMSQNTDFCRGSYIPFPQTKAWKCKDVGPSAKRCSLTYSCKPIRKNRSRLSESRRIKKEMVGLKATSGKFKVWVSKKPVFNVKRYRVEKVDSAKDIKALPDKVEKRKDVTKAAFDQGAQTLTKKEKVQRDELKTARKEKKKMKQLEREELESLAESDIEEETADEANWEIEEEKATGGDEHTYKVKPKNQKDTRISTKSGKRLKLWSFKGSYTIIKDSNSSSLSTMDGAWTPTYALNEKWSTGIHLGGHFIKTEEPTNATDEPETFLTYDLGIFGMYHYGQFFAQLGLGIQKWTDTVGDSYNTLTLGGGYIFKKYQLFVIDRVFFDYVSVSNDAKNKEMKIGAGISF